MNTSTQQTKVLTELSHAKKIALTKLIKKNNELYGKANRRERKILILKDALNLLNTKKLFDLTAAAYLYSDQNISIDQRSLLAEDSQICSVCARGALFLSRVRLNNNFNNVYDADEQDFRGNNNFSEINGFSETLKDAFNKDELSLIEACFELSSAFLTDELRRRIFSLKDFRSAYNEWTIIEVINKSFEGSLEERFRKIASIIIEAKGDVIKPLLKEMLKCI